jgi:curved DNA-binding protein CbpA
MSAKNYYAILQVKITATIDEIKASYRLLAKQYHPDKNLDNKAAEEFFKEIQEAYSVLSNPEKRRKYDLRFFYRSSSPHKKATYTNQPYSGNAYQYAQQQAQNKKWTYASPQQQQRKKDNSELTQIIVSIGIAIILLYFIISYSSEESSPKLIKEHSTLLHDASERAVNANSVSAEEPAISDYESPYSNFFGEEISDSQSKNCINIHNSEDCETVVCLVQNQQPFKTIRNQYMSRGSEFKMNQIPDGKYFLKIFYGTDWDRTKTFLKDKSVKGGFKNEIGFVELNKGKDVLKMKQEQVGTSNSFSSYEITISPDSNDKVKTITAEEFFAIH